MSDKKDLWILGIPQTRILIMLMLFCTLVLGAPVSGAIQLYEGVNDLGLISYKEAPKTWTVNLDDFEKVEVGTYSSGNTVPSRYGGWRAYLTINGERIWANFGTHDITDYNLGKTVKETEYRNQYYDLTTKFHNGQNTVTYYHYTGDGDHGLKIRVTKGTPATTVPTPVPPTTALSTPSLSETGEIQTCQAGNCGAIKVFRYNGADVTGPLTAEQRDIAMRINQWLDKVDPVYGTRSVDRDITLDIVTDSSAPPFWRESENLLQIPTDANDLDIAHELGHYTSNGIMMANGGTPSDVPIWFREGIAEHVASLATGMKTDTRMEYFTGNVMMASSESEVNAAAKDALATAMTAKKSGDLHFTGYGVSATFVEFLQKKYQKKTVIIAMVDSSKGESLIPVIESRTGRDFSTLEKEWLEYLDEEYDIYGMTGFVTPTPTPKPLSQNAQESLQGVPVIGRPVGSIISGFLQIFGL